MESFTASPHIQAILRNLPHRPGCYIMKDADGKIIYVGKAIDLRSRVRSYFDSSVYDPKTLRLREHIVDIEFIVLPSEIEALHTEYQLIQKHKPRFNIRFKDDKQYPYIAVRWGQDFPRVELTRRMEKDGTRYFGPYTSAWAVRETLDALRKAFPYLTCDRVITGNDPRACLYYDIKLCNGPCIGAVNRDEYRAGIKNLMDFLDGRSTSIIDDTRDRMAQAAEDLQFERAAALRDQLHAMERIVQRQRVVFPVNVDQDVIAFAQDKNDACVQVMFIRGGRLVGREYFLLEGSEDASDAEVMGSFVRQFYEDAASIPPELLLPNEVEEARLIEQWLKDKRGGKKVQITVPHKGNKRELVRIAADNAQETLTMLKAQWASDTNKQTEAIEELQKALNLAQPPTRIECFDVSTLQGTHTIASRVVFVKGVARKNEYRKFNIRSVSEVLEPNDFAAMREALTRRFQNYAEAVQNPEAAPGKKDQDETWRLLPDLLIVDGGKGQLSVAVAVLQQFYLLDKVPVVGLAKQFEEMFVPGNPVSILLPRRSQALYLIQRVRDEAHRFAITANRSQRNKAGLSSRLEQIKGIGPAKRKALLQHFDRNIDAIKSASVEDLMKVPGISRQIAEIIKGQL